MSQPSVEKKGLGEARMTNGQTRIGLGAELLFFVVGGQEDPSTSLRAGLAVLVEAVNQTFDGVGRGSHGR